MKAAVPMCFNDEFCSVFCQRIRLTKLAVNLDQHRVALSTAGANAGDA
jgi:hypothetical protein